MLEKKNVWQKKNRNNNHKNYRERELQMSKN